MRTITGRHRSTLFLASLAMSLLFATAADAQAVQGKAAWKRFTADNGRDWRVKWSAAGDQATRLRGLSPAIAGDPETAAATFLSANADVLGIRPDLPDVSVASVRESAGSHHVTYQQWHDGLPVFNGFVDVHLTTAGEVYLVHNDTAPARAIAALPRKPHLSPADAVWLAQAAHFNTPLADKRGNPLWATSSDVTDGPEVGIQKAKTGGRLAYRVTIGVVRYVIDGTSGEVLDAEPLIQYATGTGRVFSPNPVATLNDATLRDNNNTDYAALSAAYLSQWLRSITSTGTGATLRYRLQGPHVLTFDVTTALGGACMTDETQVRLPPPVSTTTSFNFNRSQPHFEHTMVYFHIDRSQRYIQSLGFNNLFNNPIRVDAHAFTADNSFYCRDAVGAGYLAFGDGGVDDAEDADVILHEYGHALQDAASLGKYAGGGQAGAMGEGFGDYWAFSQRASRPWGPCFAEWDGQGTCLRRLDRNKRYPRDYVQGEIHANGEIWSRGLHDLYRTLGKTVADKIILESHFLIPASPTFSQGLTALLDADEILFPPGTHKDVICSTFIDRGISAPDCGYWLLMTWNKVGTNVDLHLRPPAGFSNTTYYYAGDVAYYNKNPEWGDPASTDDNPKLDRNCITTCTSERITVDSLPTPGTYRVMAHYYNAYGRGSVTVTMEVYRGDTLLFPPTSRLMSNPGSKSQGQVWFPYDIVIAPTGKVEIAEVDEVGTVTTGVPGAPGKK